MSHRFILFLAVTLSLLLSGCATLSGYRDAAILRAGYQRKAVAEATIVKVRADYDAKLAENARILVGAQEAFTKGLRDNAQFAADRLYGADFTFQTLLRPDRAHVIMDNKVNEARAVLPPPSVAAMAKENAEVKRLLDETLTSLDQLKTEHDKALADAKVVTDRAMKAESDLVAAKQAKLNIEAAKARELEANQRELNKANNAVIDAEHARGDDAKARQATLEKLSWAAGVLAALCFAGAIFSPIYKVELGAFGAVMAVGAVGIWYLTGPVILGIVLVAVAGVLWRMTYKHRVSTDTNTALVNAVQDVKEKAPEAYATAVKPALAAWTTKYAKDASGATVAVPDTSVTAHIEAQLATSNRV